MPPNYIEMLGFVEPFPPRRPVDELAQKRKSRSGGATAALLGIHLSKQGIEQRYES
jgi:hypothetical protein